MSIPLRLARWSEIHALVVLAATAFVLAGASLWSLIAAAAVSFAGFIWTCRAGWPRPDRFDPANALTTARLAGVLLLPSIAPVATGLVLAACAIALFALDAVDGWLARKIGVTSEFGEYLDKEADAFFMLVLCLLLHADGRLGAWIIAPGLLRYGFVFFLMLARPRALKERRSTRGRWIYFGMISALIAGFTPFPLLYRPCVAAMSLALVYSFAETVFDLYRAVPAARES